MSVNWLDVEHWGGGVTIASSLPDGHDDSESAAEGRFS